MVVRAGISSCHPPESPILVSTAVRPRLQGRVRQELTPKSDTSGGQSWRVGGCKLKASY